MMCLHLLLESIREWLAVAEELYGLSFMDMKKVTPSSARSAVVSGVGSMVPDLGVQYGAR
jgi:hypothetical protein